VPNEKKRGYPDLVVASAFTSPVDSGRMNAQVAQQLQCAGRAVYRNITTEDMARESEAQSARVGLEG
jgi:hypothetical protein